MSREAAAVAAGAGIGTIATLLLRARAAQAVPAPEGVDPATWDMMLSLMETVAVEAQAIQQLRASIDALVRTMGGAAVAEVGEDPFKNTKRFVTGQVVCTALNTGFQLPSFPIPKNKQIGLKAMPGNGGWIAVGYTQSSSQSATVAYMLLPNEGVGLFVENSEAVWVAAVVALGGILNDGVTFIVEQE